MSIESLLVDDNNDWKFIEKCCYEQHKYDFESYDECFNNYFGRGKEYWRCPCCCRWSKEECKEECKDKGECCKENQCKDEEECEDKNCTHNKGHCHKICIPKSYIPVPCVYPVQCLAVCKNSRCEQFRIYVNDLLGFSIKFRIKEHPHKGTVRLDSKHSGKGSYTPHYDALGFDSFVITVCSMHDNKIVHSVDTTIRVRIDPCDSPCICDLNCDCCMPHRDCEE